MGALVAPLASVAPAGKRGPSCFGTCSRVSGAEMGEGLLEAGTPKTQLLHLVRSKEWLGHACGR